MSDEKLIKELRKLFLQSHRKWEAVNNPKGYTSGEVHIAWGKRIVDLLVLVHAQQKVKD